jgi:oligopeptide transport system substrate-binding protein
VKLNKRPAALVATALAGAMLLSACGGSDDSGSDSASGGDGGTFSMYIGEPQNALVPGNTTESEGDQVVNSLWTGLVSYTAEGEVEYSGVAESIESEDNTTWTVKLKDGWTFHDGTPVTAESYTKAWSYNALSTNAFGASYFFENIEGYADLQGSDTAEPVATELSGLSVVDDTTFTVKLNGPFATGRRSTRSPSSTPGTTPPTAPTPRAAPATSPASRATTTCRPRSTRPPGSPPATPSPRR